jgi:starch phosphorylase
MMAKGKQTSSSELSHHDTLLLLRELALNVRWTWDRGTDILWHRLEPELWERTHNPWIVLETVSRGNLDQVLEDPTIQQYIRDLVEDVRRRHSATSWFQAHHSHSPLTCVAYFSMEFMLSEALPIYSGGLGNVAGDHLKASSDLGIPIVGIGILYQQGYFRQMIDKDGNQLALYPYNDPLQLPISPLRTADGEWLRIKISLPGYSLWLRAWEVRVGRVRLFLLDSNDAANFPAHRGITSELYGGGSELRLKQELLLGIGGWRLLEALGLQPEVCHLNEGHAAFAILERASSFMKQTGQSFEAALAATRAGNIFTTHTAVPAAFDQFSPFLMNQYLGTYAEKNLKISMNDLMALGRKNPQDSTEAFNSAYLAIRGSGAINGVSRLHGAISRRIFAPIFPQWPLQEIPIGSITNGVHMPSWESSLADHLWTKTSGPERWLGDTDRLAQEVRKIPDGQIWKMRCSARSELVDFIRVRHAREREARGTPVEPTEAARKFFDSKTLTIGFARRFATYKRPNMLLHDPERLLRILQNTDRPVQLIIAGKAHPADTPGQKLIQEWVQFIQDSRARPHVIFLADYDMLLTEHLVRGVDLWLNTPRRPWEACGTSGMKVLVNGGLNLSELDGWWAEAYSPEVGWALGDGQEHDNIAEIDAQETECLYDLLEKSVIPEFYDVDAHGIPSRWVARIRESMARLTPQFSSNRTVREYTERRYLPAATEYARRAKDKASEGCRIADAIHQLNTSWKDVCFGAMRAASCQGMHTFSVQVDLGSLSPDSVKVELYAEGADPIEMERGQTPNLYTLCIPAKRPVEDYTPRIIPRCSHVNVPLECPHITWQK